MKPRGPNERGSLRHGLLPVAFATLGLSILSAGCQSGPPPAEQLAVSQAAVEQAQAAGADKHAAAELASARDKLARAQAVAKDDAVQARRLAEEAEVDAQLAIVKAGSTRAQLAATELERSTRALRDSLATEPAREPAREPTR